MIYLDNAATTLKKPPSVTKAMVAAMQNGANAGRGGHEGGRYAEKVYLDCRIAAARLFGLENPENVVFTCNATHALNIAVASVVKRGMRVVCSGYEHNAAYRPLVAKRNENVETAVVHSPLFEPEVFLYKLENELRLGADAVVCTHVSNVFGYVLPIERVDALCYAKGIPLIIDASQSAGCIELDAKKLKAAHFIAMPGHKGLYGPQGTGLLLNLRGITKPLIYGGTGGDSINEGMPEYLPERLEAGTGNLPGIAGLLEGIRFVEKAKPTQILSHEKTLVGLLAAKFSAYPQVKVYAAEKLFCQTGVLSFNVRGADSETVATEFATYGFAVRAGLHCAPLAHKSAETLETGAVRASVSWFARPWEINAFAEACGKIARQV